MPVLYLWCIYRFIFCCCHCWALQRRWNDLLQRRSFKLKKTQVFRLAFFFAVQFHYFELIYVRAVCFCSPSICSLMCYILWYISTFIFIDVCKYKRLIRKMNEKKIIIFSLSINTLFSLYSLVCIVWFKLKCRSTHIFYHVFHHMCSGSNIIHTFIRRWFTFVEIFIHT